MFIKVENKNPKATYMTTKGNRTPKLVWQCTESGLKGMTQKGIIKHKERLEKMGVTWDMTEEEIDTQIEGYLKNKHN